MGYISSILLLGTITLLYNLYRVYSRRSIKDIPGPKPKSFLLGSYPELFGELAGESDFKWQNEFGGIVRVKAPLGEDMLMVTDPKALQYIYHTSGYNFPKQPDRRTVSWLVGDHGLTWADGDTHKRQRKVMLPAFGMPESKALLPVFEHYAERVTLKWKEMLLERPDHSAEFNIASDITPATLDAIGEAAFDYKFGLTENQDNELARAYRDLLATIFGSPTPAKLFVSNLFHYVPMPIQEWYYNHASGKAFEKARFNRTAAQKVAKELLAMKSEALSLGKEHRDIMSIIVRANNSEDERTKLDYEEVLSQMRTIMLAGQETTSNTLCWAFLELAKHPEIQTRLREEIRTMERTVQARGDTSIGVSDMENMPYLQAFLREVLRFHSVVPHNFRQSLHEDVIPLSKPIRTNSGKMISEIPIRKGLRLVLSVAAYHRNKDVWGEDADLFNPERWLAGKKGPTVGVTSSLLTFAGGVRGCIGWRFAMYEMQAFICDLVSDFEFGLTDDIKRLRRLNALVMVPTLEGEVDKGVQMPLRVSLAARD